MAAPPIHITPTAPRGLAGALTNTFQQPGNCGINYIHPNETITVTMLPLPLEDRAALIELEESMWREETRFDLAFQELRFAPDFVEFGRSGRTYTRQQIIRTDARPIQAILPLPNLQVRVLDVNTVQLTYDSEVIYDCVAEYAHRGSIWSRAKGSWIMRFHQGTPYEP